MRKGLGKKLLVASVGVAAISYTACLETSGNLLPPPQVKDSGADTASDASEDGGAPADTASSQAQENQARQ